VWRGRAKDLGRNAAAGGAEQQRVAAAVVERDGLRFLPERCAALLVGVDRQRDSFNGGRRLSISGTERTGDVD